MAYLESVIIRDTGGTEADVTAANALKVDGSAVTQPVTIVGGTVNTDIQVDAFQQTVVSNRYNQIEINYSTVDPDLITDITVTKTNGGDASNATGQALFTSNANTSGGVSAVTNLNVIYRPHAETYVAFTAIWTSGGLANSVQRIGLFDINNGFFIGYEGATFGVTIRKGGVDTQTAQASFNIDTLTGTAGSKYTRNGVPEAANFALDNLFRIRFGWLGAAPIQWEILSPDGEWVLFHIMRHPNTVAAPTINDPDLPIALEIQKTAAGATVLNMNTACWAAGTSSNFQKVTENINDNTLATLTRSVITGVTTAGGGGYVNVKVNPSGALVTQPDNNYDEDTAHASGDTGGFILAVRNDSNTAMTSANGDYSPIAVNANGAVAINDGGNSITVDGSITVSSGSITAATDTSYAEDSAHVSGSKGTFILAVRNDANTDFNATDGDYTPVAVTGAGAVKIHDGGNSITVDGTVASTQSGTWNVVAAGDVAHDSPDSGNPVKIGFQAETVLPAAVANGDRTNGTADQFGRQLVTHISPGMQTWKSGNYTTTQTGVALWTPAAGKTVAVTYLAVSSYATTAGRVIVWFGASGDTTYTAGTDQLVWAGSFAPTANSKPGAILTFNTPIFSANADYVLRVTTDAGISLDVSVYGYEF